MPELDWMWFTIILVTIFCATFVIIGIHGRRDLKQFRKEMPTLPKLTSVEELKNRDNRIMMTVQEGLNDNQGNAEGR